MFYVEMWQYNLINTIFVTELQRYDQFWSRAGHRRATAQMYLLCFFFGTRYYYLKSTDCAIKNEKIESIKKLDQSTAVCVCVQARMRTNPIKKKS